LRASCRAVSPPGAATALPTTAGLFRGWCGLHNTSPGANYLPSRTLYSTRCHRKAEKIVKDNNHPSHCLFTPLPSRKEGQCRCIKAGTEKLLSLYLKAIRLLNSHH
jgi:hypothetical protein